MKKEKEAKKYNVKDYYRPYKNNILLKWEVQDKTEAGVIIPDHLQEKKLGLEVIAVGEAVKDIKVGELIVILPNTPIGTFKLFDEEFAQIADYQVFAVVSPEYTKANREFLEKKNKEDKTKIDVIN